MAALVPIANKSVSFFINFQQGDAGIVRGDPGKFIDGVHANECPKDAVEDAPMRKHQDVVFLMFNLFSQSFDG